MLVRQQRPVEASPENRRIGRQAPVERSRLARVRDELREIVHADGSRGKTVEERIRERPERIASLRARFGRKGADVRSDDLQAFPANLLHREVGDTSRRAEQHDAAAVGRGGNGDGEPGGSPGRNPAWGCRRWRSKGRAAIIETGHAGSASPRRAGP